MTVLQGGNLGIGTTTPSALFAVTGGAGTYVNSSGSFIAATNGPHAIGRTTRGDVQLTIGGTFGSGPTARGVLIETTLGPDPGQSTAALVVAPTIQEHSSATHTRFASVQIDAPTITAGDAALTNAVSLYVSGAPTGATNNYALLIGSGTVSLGTGNVGIGTTGPGATLDVYQGGATNGQSNIRSYNDNNGFSRELLTLDATNASLIENAGAAYFRIRASGLGKEYFWVGQTGNVGIGTTSPAGKLHISSESSTNTLYFSDAAGSGNHSIQFRDAAVDEWHLTRSDSDNVFNIVESNVLIRAAFMPGGGIKFNSGLGTGVGGNYLCIDTTTFEVLRGNGSACTASSLRFKDNIQNLNYGLAEVLKLRPVSYQYKQDTNMGQGTKLGFIAEEMYQVIPEVTSLNKDGKVFGLDYPVLTAVLTKAIQELNAKLETLTAQNGTINSSSSFTSSSALTVASLTSTNGTWSLDDSGHLVVKKITAEDIETENLKVGSPEKRNGITIYDQDTGDPYCMYIASGAVRSAPGPCSATSGDQQPVDTSPSPSPSPTQESTPTSEPSPAEPENPAPAATPSEE
ncbi:MAG: tail fiber domain-containing protein [Patescibacteria group bacterium]|nr:tail fiber domain-containing protein [Patescibacteria group bacterium]